MEDRSHLLTEQRLAESMELDAMPLEEAIKLMNRQDQAAVAAEHVEGVIDRGRQGEQVEDAAGAAIVEFGGRGQLAGAAGIGPQRRIEHAVARPHQILTLPQPGLGRL